jgi:phage terminase large subunit
LRVFKTPGPNRDYHAYLIGGDPAWTESNMSDHSAAHVLNRRTWEQVAVFRRKMDAHDFGEQLLLLGEWFNDAIIAPDATKGGGATVEYLRAKQYPNIWIHKKAGKWRGQPERTYGFVTNANTKYESISNLQSLIADSARTGMGITIHDEATFAELSDFVVLVGAKMGNSDKTGFDDLVTALAITVTCTLYEALNLPTATPIAQRSTSIPTEHLRDHDVGVAPETSVDDRGRTVITAAPDTDVPPWLENHSTAFDFEGA